MFGYQKLYYRFSTYVFNFNISLDSQEEITTISSNLIYHLKSKLDQKH